jgi:hypothetical protein
VHIITATATDSGDLTGSDEITITVITAVLSFNPSDDALVNSKRPTSNYGSSTSLELRAQSRETIDSYLKFVITGVHGTVKSARLRLYAIKGSSFGGSVYAVSNNYLNTTTLWTEDGLVWENAPGLEGAPLSTTDAVIGGTWVEFDVTAVLQGDGVYSFAMGSNSPNRVSYRSVEATENQPVLVIEIESDS